jgi:predicted small secreted protein
MKTAKIVCILAGLFLTGALSACNTVHGAGKDLQVSSEAVSKSIDNVRTKSK